MATPEVISDYDRNTASNNTPAGSDTISNTLDDELRDIKKNIRAVAEWPVQTKSAAYTTAITDIHTLIEVDASATGSILVTLMSAVTAGDGHTVGVGRAVEADGTLTIGTINVTSASGNIDGTGTFALPTGVFSNFIFVSDGTHWKIASSGIAPTSYVTLVMPNLTSLTEGHAVVADSTGTGLKTAGFILEEGFDSGDVAVFIQANAPTNWTRSNESTDHTIILAKTGDVGAGEVGQWAITGLTNGNTGSVTLTAAQSGLPAHTHTYGNAQTDNEGAGDQITYHNGTTTGTTFTTTANSAANASEGHAHAGSTITHTTATWRPLSRYGLKCTKDARQAL